MKKYVMAGNKIKYSFVLVLFLMLIIISTGCASPAYDFDKMEDNLSEKFGESYDIKFENNTVYITRTYTFPSSGRNRESIANLSEDEFDKWANGWWFIVGNEQVEYEEIFRENGDEFDVLITYRLRDAEGNEIGMIDINGCAFTLEDLQPYKTNESEDAGEFSGESDDRFYGHVDVESAIMNTYAILNNYLDGRNVQFDMESLMVMAENIDEVMASALLNEKPISITNDGYVVEIEYDKAIIYWGLGAEASKVSVIEK